LSKGATVATTANTADKNNLIDDTEDTGAQIATAAPVAGSSMTVKLAGSTPVMVSSVNVSTSAGPNNSGRFIGVRKFEIRTCNGTCADPVADFTNVAFTSADDAFPGDVPRPLQPNLNLRSFAITPTLATHVQLRVLTTQCTGQAKFAGDQDDDPFNNSDCAGSASGAIARATDFEVFGPAVAQADLFVDKNGPDTVKRGENFDYTIDVKNNGPSMANGVTLTDFLPKNAGFGSASSTQGTCSFKPVKRLVTCDLGNIASGATVTVTVTVKATDQKPIINKASVEAASPADPNLNNNTDTKTTTVGP
jgi:uncharacterized repeat protein (TIGR01451 family)